MSPQARHFTISGYFLICKTRLNYIISLPENQAFSNVYLMLRKKIRAGEKAKGLRDRKPDFETWSYGKLDVELIKLLNITPLVNWG